MPSPPASSSSLSSPSVSTSVSPVTVTRQPSPPSLSSSPVGFTPWPILTLATWRQQPPHRVALYTIALLAGCGLAITAGHWLWRYTRAARLKWSDLHFQRTSNVSRRLICSLWSSSYDLEHEGSLSPDETRALMAALFKSMVHQPQYIDSYCDSILGDGVHTHDASVRDRLHPLLILLFSELHASASLYFDEIRGYLTDTVDQRIHHDEFVAVFALWIQYQIIMRCKQQLTL